MDRVRHHACSRRQALAGLASSLMAPAAAWAQAAPGTEVKEVPPPALGSPLALPDMTLLDGSSFRASEARGHVVVLYWWASWCPFCAQQSPHMNQLWVAHKNRGLRMLCLSIDRQAEDARGYLARKGYSFPAALVTPAVARVLPKPKGLPVTIVLGREGRVLSADTGQLFPEDVEQIAQFL